MSPTSERHHARLIAPLAPLWRSLRYGVSALTTTLVPPVCLQCNEPLAAHDGICGACWRRIDFIGAPLCDRTGLPLPYDTGGVMISAGALAQPPAYDRARASAHYNGVMRDLIHHFKYNDRHDLRHLLARWLMVAAEPLLPDTDFIVPVPLNRLKLLRRRFNQSAILAQDLARASGIAYEPQMLRRIKRTEPQVGKTMEQRRRNVQGAFAAGKMRGRLAGRNILLVDDVITTGATIEACARALKAAGAARVDVAALAKTTGLDRDAL